MNLYEVRVQGLFSWNHEDWLIPEVNFEAAVTRANGRIRSRRSLYKDYSIIGVRQVSGLYLGPEYHKSKHK